MKAAERERDAAERQADAQRKQEVAAAEARREAARADAEAVKTRDAAKGEAVASHRRALAQGYGDAGDILRASFPNADDNEIIALLAALDRNRMLDHAANGQANTIMLPQGTDSAEAGSTIYAAKAAQERS